MGKQSFAQRLTFTWHQTGDTPRLVVGSWGCQLLQRARRRWVTRVLCFVHGGQLGESKSLNSRNTLYKSTEKILSTDSFLRPQVPIGSRSFSGKLHIPLRGMPFGVITNHIHSLPTTSACGVLPTPIFCFYFCFSSTCHFITAFGMRLLSILSKEHKEITW